MRILIMITTILALAGCVDGAPEYTDEHGTVDVASATAALTSPVAVTGYEVETQGGWALSCFAQDQIPFLPVTTIRLQTTAGVVSLLFSGCGGDHDYLGDDQFLVPLAEREQWLSALAAGGGLTLARNSTNSQLRLMQSFGVQQ